MDDEGRRPVDADKDERGPQPHDGCRLRRSGCRGRFDTVSVDSADMDSFPPFRRPSCNWCGDPSRDKMAGPDRLSE